MTLFTDLFATLDTTLEAFRTAAANNLGDYVRGGVRVGAIVAFILMGAEGLFGGVISMKKAIGTAFMVAFVSIFAVNSANYSQYIGDYLMDLPDDFLKAMNPEEFSNTAGIGNYLDGTITSMGEGIGKIWGSAGLEITGGSGVFAPIMLGVVLLVLLICMGAAAMISIIVGKVTIALIVALGPLFIMALVIPGLKDWFTKWLSYAFSMAILQLLIGAVILLAQTILDTYATELTSTTSSLVNNPVGALSPAIVMLVLTYIFGQLPNMASSLGGGIGITTGNAAARGVSAAGAAVGARVAAGAAKAAGAMGKGMEWLSNAGSGIGGGKTNSVSSGQTAYQRVAQRNAQEAKAKTDAPKTSVERTTGAQQAMQRLEQKNRTKPDDNGEKK